jgi:hypothetical protein
MRTVHGIAETKAALLALEARLLAAAPIASRSAAEAFGEGMAAAAPRNTGATAASITVASEGATAHVGPTTPWARFTEYGTVYITAMAWMERGVDQMRSPALQKMEEVFRAAVHV